MPENALANETSPYLLQHKDNPVAWQPWSEETLAQAARENKPILLSVGYAACHWCHVMAHESFENDEIAALMNELFVNIKVDREERPDLDTIYQTALALLGEHGGWPLTMFLTPKGEPFWGGTYFPREPRYGRPGFAQVLRAVADAYRQQPEKVRQNVDALSEALDRQGRASERGTVSLDQFDPLARQLIRVVDPALGGLAQPPKFPHTPVFEFLWRNYLRTGAEDMRDAVIITCTRMSEGGICDHLGGGFARYSTDAEWLVPHFEKMLYDNAQLIDLLTMVWQETRKPLFARRIAETVDWVQREMTTEEGAFASSIDADSEGEEGKFYVWTEAQIDALLGDDAPFFKQVYDVRPEGNWEGHTILNRSKAPPLSEADESRLEPLRRTLWEAREQRVRPGWDDKVLADWNGLMIAALADAGAVFDRPDWIAAAERAFAFVTTTMSAGDRLLHAYRAGKVRHPAMLDDYALMARAALRLHEVTGDPALLARAEAWADVVEQHFKDPDEGGYFMTADDAERLIVRTKSVQDAALPAGNAVMIEVFARLYHLTGNATYRERADAQIEAFAGQLNRNAFGLMTFLNNVELFLDGRQIVIVGHRDDPRVRAFVATVRDLSLPHRTIKVLPPGADLPPGHPASGKGQIDGAPTVYLCVGTTCSLPVTEPAQLRDLLLQSRASGP